MVLNFLKCSVKPKDIKTILYLLKSLSSFFKKIYNFVLKVKLSKPI